MKDCFEFFQGFIIHVMRKFYDQIFYDQIFYVVRDIIDWLPKERGGEMVVLQGFICIQMEQCRDTLTSTKLKF